MRSSATASEPAEEGPEGCPDAARVAGEDSAAGPAHVATVSFLASRAVPSGGFWVALAGGMALARISQRRGAREGYGASVAATLETVAIIGPARFGVPFTQALSAPMLGRLEARGWRFWAQVLACAAVRVLSNSIGAAFFIWVIAGGLDAYAGSYDALAERFGFTLGERGTLVLTAAGLLVWGAFASIVQVGVYRRGLRDWPDAAGAPAEAPPVQDADTRGRFDPRAVVLAAVIAFGLLLSGTSWPLLGACAAWLALAWATSRPDGAAVPTGLVLAAVLAGGALIFTLAAGLGLDEALRRASARCPARARGHLAAGGGPRAGAARGLTPCAGQTAPPPVRARGGANARCDRLRGTHRRRRPGAARRARRGAAPTASAAGRGDRLGGRGGRALPARCARAAHGAAGAGDRCGARGGGCCAGGDLSHRVSSCGRYSHPNRSLE